MARASSAGRDAALEELFRSPPATFTRDALARRLRKELDVPAKAHLDEIASALQAALVDPAIGEQLEEGRLEEIPAPAAGFGEERTPRTVTRTRTQPQTQTQTPTQTQTQTPTRTRTRTQTQTAAARAAKRTKSLRRT